MRRSDNISELAKALSAFQGAMKSVPKKQSNPYFKSKYADLDAIWDVVRNPLRDNGLSVVQTTDSDADGNLVLETTLFHTSGEYIGGTYPLTPMRQVKDVGWEASGDPQSLGSATTYARRYALSALLGISAEEDDDAEGAMNRDNRAPAQRPARQATALDPNSQYYCAEHKVMRFKRGQMPNYAHPILNATGEPVLDDNGRPKWCNQPKDQEPTQDPTESEQEQAFEDLGNAESAPPETGVTILKHTDFWKAAHERYGEGQAGVGRDWQMAWDHVCTNLKVG